MQKVARGGGTNHRRADNKETHSNWIMVAAGYFKTGVSGLFWSVWSEPSERPS